MDTRRTHPANQTDIPHPEMSQEANDKLDRLEAKAALSKVREKVENSMILEAILQDPGDDVRDNVAILHEGERIVPEEHIQEGWNVVRVPLSAGGTVRIYVGKPPFNTAAQSDG